jgi:hemerythrin-like domain-containing protein
MVQKRNLSLQPLSREHHFALLLGFKINAGIRNNIERIRIEKYTKWFYENYLLKHFKEEEEILFPILGLENSLVKKAIEEHDGLKSMMKKNDLSIEELATFAENLKNHIRFEERELFNEIQHTASVEQLKMLEEKLIPVVFIENDEDAFWAHKN